MLGVIDVGTEEVERRRRSRPGFGRRCTTCRCAALPCTDCGMVPRQPGVAIGKMHALVAGADIVRRNLAGSSRAETPPWLCHPSSPGKAGTMGVVGGLSGDLNPRASTSVS